MFSDRKQVNPVEDYQPPDWYRYVRRAIKAEYCGRVLARALNGEPVAKDIQTEAQTYFLWGRYDERSSNVASANRNSGTSEKAASTD